MESIHSHWQEEKQSAYLYRVLAKADTHAERRDLFLKLASAADEQAEMWFVKSGEPSPWVYRPTLRVRIVAALVSRFGLFSLRTVLWAMKVRGMAVLSPLMPSSGHATPTSVDDVGKRHHSASSSGNLRAAVFGVNDGLISNASLILGVAGATANTETLLIAGVAGGLAGAFSMAAGEFVSVKSQRDMLTHQIALERDELAQYPEEEAKELALIYEARGLSQEVAAEWSQRMIADPEKGLRALVREELGLDPDDLSSPWAAGIFSFVAFAVGSVVPMIPILMQVSRPLPYTIGVTACALFIVGATISLFTGRGAILSGLRMMAIGGAAGFLTHLIGTWLGA